MYWDITVLSKTKKSFKYYAEKMPLFLSETDWWDNFNYTKKKQIMNNLYEIYSNQSCELMLLWETRCMKYFGERIKD